ncbi:hypothetical protein SERLADRAFT_467213 [Serpula lacrymans var. lacrymans S7.9]|uniref:Indoleamine 2,3-dioxygenase n=1 Tax=Serpula lacrymans var. lacrymans (strain S7.9) TaxID=578457 RepID=F8NVT2_SERL9|nr:uncharacterized protein SERLADRAFT_467213 [Serpula lacrymans var. lacrymans S7.9]EGO24243.1 hypothetical protein SERLADRAFT_467213 [Serpula lacrymans var. lacrymans S7.9]
MDEFVQLETLSPQHFLSLPRPDIIIGTADGVPDTSTLAAHDFDVDTRTGFMPPDPPPSRLPLEWEPWEAVLEDALKTKLQLGGKPGITPEEAALSSSWRARVRETPILSTLDLTNSELLLRRAHHVLVFIMHMYIHTQSLDTEIRIPPSISIPLLQVSSQLQLPAVGTYSDTVLYNWDLKSPSSDPIPAIHNLRSQDLFTGTNDEQEFYLASSRIEIRGVEALELMRATMDEMFVGDDIAVRRITSFLHKMTKVVDELKDILLAVRDGCDPEFFYHSVRPWFCGADSDPAKRKWVFEGLEEYPELQEPTELSGPSAGQSTLIHSLDIFLGLDNCSTQNDPDDRWSLLRRMQNYMPRHHLSSNPRPLRSLVAEGDPKLLEAYNATVNAVKEFRDAHIRIVAIYIIGPSRKAKAREAESSGSESIVDENGRPLKGTGGTNLSQFLKGVRDKTAEAMILPRLA